MANTYHSIIFEYDSGARYHTWDNWHLIPSSRPDVVQPTPAYKNIEIPGKSGTLDLSEYLTGVLPYSDRKGTFEFIAVNNVGNVKFNGPARDFVNDLDFQKIGAQTYGDWVTRKSTIASVLDGRKMKVFLEDDPDHYYYGRVFFKEWRSDPQFSKVVIEYQFNPFKYTLSGEEAGL